MFLFLTGINGALPTFGTHEIQTHIDNRSIDTIAKSNRINFCKEKISKKRQFLRLLFANLTL